MFFWLVLRVCYKNRMRLDIGAMRRVGLVAQAEACALEGKRKRAGPAKFDWDADCAQDALRSSG